MLPITTFLFPPSSHLLLDEIICEGQTLFLTVHSSQETVCCPHCATVAGKVHSQYVRTLADVSLMDSAVRLHVRARRFFCSNPTCSHKTFAESFADLTQAALSRRESNGQTKGKVNKLKWIKRQMYRRAAFDLLRQRVLLCR